MASLFQPFSVVKTTQEAALDSNLFVQMTSAFKHHAQSTLMPGDAGGFDVDDFVSKLVTYMGGNLGGRQRESPELDEEDEEDTNVGPLHWEKVGRLALAKSRRVPVMDFMCAIV